MDFIKLQLKHMQSEPSPSAHDRFVDPAFARKLPKFFTPCDYDRDEKLIEIEFDDGRRNWIEVKQFFGKVIGEVKEILLLYPDGHTEGMSIVGFKIYKVKRTMYWNLVFEMDLPF